MAGSNWERVYKMAFASVYPFRSSLRHGEAPPTQTTPAADHVSDGQRHREDNLLETARAAPLSENYELVRIPLTRDCTAELRLAGKVTSAAIDRLVQYIELMRGVWAEEG